MQVKKVFTILMAGMGLIAGSSWAQTHRCGTAPRMHTPAGTAAPGGSAQTLRPQQGQSAKAQAVTTIPVVVHVVYNPAVENITDAQILSQIDVLNADYRRLNADTLGPGHPFRAAAADVEVQFCMATRDPSGAPTNGITRTHTTQTSFSTNNVVKSAALGGQDNWDPTQYLNIWVCDLQPVMGYASFPGDLAAHPEADGVVISYRAFGTMGTVQAPFDRGRTATHEIGHWLNLYHIFSGPPCGDDSLADTPPAEGLTYGCPTFPHHPNNACGSGPDGEMFMNFMTSVDDSCMNTFTNDQKARMQAVLATQRLGIQSSLACSPPMSAHAPAAARLTVAPNPSTGQVALSWTGAPGSAVVTVMNALGETVLQSQVDAFPCVLSLHHLPQELYFVQVRCGESLAVTKVLLAH